MINNLDLLNLLTSMIKMKSLLILFMELSLLAIPKTNKGTTLRTDDYGGPRLWRKIEVPKSLFGKQ